MHAQLKNRSSKRFLDSNCMKNVCLMCILFDMYINLFNLKQTTAYFPLIILVVLKLVSSSSQINDLLKMRDHCKVDDSKLSKYIREHINTTTGSLIKNKLHIERRNNESHYQPWSAAIFDFNPQYRGSNVHVCSGAIITQHIIITAAHCLYTKLPNGLFEEKNTTFMRIGVGFQSLDTKNLHLESNNLIKIHSLIKMDDFVIDDPKKLEKQNSSELNDLALIRMSVPVKFKDTVKPLCISNGNLNLLQSCSGYVVAGFGPSDKEGKEKGNEAVACSPEGNLQEIVVKILDQPTCIKQINYKYIGEYFCLSPLILQETFYPKVVCNHKVSPYTGIAQGFDGSPALTAVNNHWYAVGILSYIETDAQPYGVLFPNLNDSFVIDWINQTQQILMN